MGALRSRPSAPARPELRRDRPAVGGAGSASMDGSTRAVRAAGSRTGDDTRRRLNLSSECLDNCELDRLTATQVFDSDTNTLCHSPLRTPQLARRAVDTTGSAVTRATGAPTAKGTKPDAPATGRHTRSLGDNLRLLAQSDDISPKALLFARSPVPCPNSSGRRATRGAGGPRSPGDPLPPCASPFLLLRVTFFALPVPLLR